MLYKTDRVFYPAVPVALLFPIAKAAALSRLLVKIDPDDVSWADLRDSAQRDTFALARQCVFNGWDLRPPLLILQDDLEYSWQSGVSSGLEDQAYLSFVTAAKEGKPLFSVNEKGRIESLVHPRLGCLVVPRSGVDEVLYALDRVGDDCILDRRSFMEDAYGIYTGTLIYRDNFGDKYEAGCFVIEGDHPVSGSLVLGGNAEYPEVLRQLKACLSELRNSYELSEKDREDIAERAKMIYLRSNPQAIRFAPTSGLCHSCESDWTLVVNTAEELETLTGCPYCGASWCD